MTEEERKSLTPWAACEHSIDARYCVDCMVKFRKEAYAEGRRDGLEEAADFIVDTTGEWTCGNCNSPVFWSHMAVEIRKILDQ